jgi:hypothetical protein
VASLGAVNFSLLGIALMLGSGFTEAIRLVLTQYLLKNLKFGIVEGQVNKKGEVAERGILERLFVEGVQGLRVLTVLPSTGAQCFFFPACSSL